jgi:hypothetical protein
MGPRAQSVPFRTYGSVGSGYVSLNVLVPDPVDAEHSARRSQLTERGSSDNYV